MEVYQHYWGMFYGGLSALLGYVLWRFISTIGVCFMEVYQHYWGRFLQHQGTPRPVNSTSASPAPPPPPGHWLRHTSGNVIGVHPGLLQLSVSVSSARHDVIRENQMCHAQQNYSETYQDDEYVPVGISWAHITDRGRCSLDTLHTLCPQHLCGHVDLVNTHGQHAWRWIASPVFDPHAQRFSLERRGEWWFYNY